MTHAPDASDLAGLELRQIGCRRLLLTRHITLNRQGDFGFWDNVEGGPRGFFFGCCPTVSNSKLASTRPAGAATRDRPRLNNMAAKRLLLLPLHE